MKAGFCNIYSRGENPLLWNFKINSTYRLRFIIVILFSVYGTLFAQDSASISVLDLYNKPVPGAHVQFRCLSCKIPNTRLALTGLNGEVKNPFSDSTEIYISSIGYRYLIDTLLPNQSKVLVLKYNTVDIDEVVVTAQYVVNSSSNAVHKIKVIDQKRIESLGAVNLRDILSNEANVRISQDNILGSSTSVQGLSGQNVKILIDGVPVIGRVGGNIDLSQINLNDIERIEIVEGPLAVEYGTNALAGTINLITKKSSQKKYNLNLNSYYETAGQYNFDASLKFKNKKSQFSLTGGRNFFDGWNVSDPLIKVDRIKVADSSRFNSWKPKEQKFIKGAHFGNLSNWKYRLSSDYFREKITNKGLPRAPYNETAFDDFYYTDRLSNSLNLKRKIKNRGSLNMIFAYNYFRRQKNTYYTDLITLQSNLTDYIDQDTTIFELFMARGTYANSSDSSKLNYALGYDFNIETGKGKRIKQGIRTIGDCAVFASAEYKPVTKLIIRPGLRYSYNTSYKSPVTPSLNLRYNNYNWIFRGAYSSGFRAPSIKDLYFDFVDSNHDIQGNPDLTAETSHNFSFSSIKTIIHKKNTYKITASAFYNNIDNLIALAISEGNSYSYFNLDKFKTLGAQAQLELIIENLKFTVSGTYTGRYNSLSENSSIQPFSYSPELISNVTYNIRKYNLSFSGFYKYSGKVIGYYIDEEEGIQQNLLGDFSTLDLTATKGFWKNKIKWTLGGKNLFNVRNIVSRGESGVHSSSTGSVSMRWGISVFTSLKININGNKIL